VEVIRWQKENLRRIVLVVVLEQIEDVVVVKLLRRLGRGEREHLQLEEEEQQNLQAEVETEGDINS
jgi:hypothetical protein